MICISQTGGFRVKVFIGVLLAALVAVLVIADVLDLTQRVDPVFPGVKFESKKSNPLFPGTYCSAGFAIKYSQSGGQVGFMIASHCTDPGDWQSAVFQPYYDFWRSDKNYAGYTVDRGTNDAYTETDKAKPDAAVWWVANRGVSNYVPTYLCGSSTQWAKQYDIVPESNITRYPGAWKIGFVTGCTGSDNAIIEPRDDRYSGSVYPVSIQYMYADFGDSGSIVFRWVNGKLYVIGIVIGGIPPSGPWQYVLVQSADYALRYYGYYIYK